MGDGLPPTGAIQPFVHLGPGDLGQLDRLNLEKAPGGISKATIGCSVVATVSHPHPDWYAYLQLRQVNISMDGQNLNKHLSAT